jgi:very-short-patch-repair endonuclease
LWGGIKGGGRTIADKFARQLRRNATPAERKLWQALRLLKSEGFHFRRQVPLAGYIADFACHRARLVIELDGGQHNDDAAIARDAARSTKLCGHRYTVLRFWNHDVLKDAAAVMDQIRLALPLASDLMLRKDDDPHP